VENKPLARALYAEVDIGDPVPVEYYDAIAKILEYVARIDARIASKYNSLRRRAG
jgi:flagellar biosynthetic protein FlhB